MKTFLVIAFWLFHTIALAAQTTPTVSLQWSLNDPVNPAIGWKLEKQIGIDPFSQIQQFPLGTTSYVDTLTGDTGGITYSYRVRAIGANGDGAYSTTQSVTTPGGPVNTVFAITTIGIVADTVGSTTPTPDGMQDVKVRLVGLKSVPTSIKVTPNQGGYYEYPFNGSSWVPFLLNFNGGAGDLFYTYPYNIPGLKNHIVIKYSDGTTAQADG